MEQLTQLLDIITRVIQFIGGAWMLYGVVIFAMALKNHDAPDIKSGLMQMGGGVAVMLVSQLVNGLATGLFTT